MMKRLNLLIKIPNDEDLDKLSISQHSISNGAKFNNEKKSIDLKN